MEPTTDKFRVLIVDDIGEQREQIKKMLYFEPDFEVVDTASNGQEAIELTRRYRPHIVLMDINMPGVDGLAATEAVSRESSFTQVVIMSVQNDSAYLRRAVAAGARDYLFKPFGYDEMVNTLRRVCEKSMHIWANGLPEAVTVAAPVPTTPVKLAKVIAVYSPKGGVGCTTLAVNLATAMQQLAPRSKIAMIDGDLQFGSVDVSLNIRDKRTIADLGDNLNDLDVDLLNRTLIEDSRSGLKVLIAPPRPELADLVTAEHLRTVLEVTREAFDIVVVDVGSRLLDAELSVLDLADRIVLVVVPDLAAVRHIRHFLNLVQALEYPMEKVLLVLNKSRPRTGITPQAVARVLKHEVYAELPYDDQVVLESVNRGLPYMLMPNIDKRTPVIQCTGQLAQKIGQELENIE
jgi:pilus assembly protein CpaE